MVGNTDPLDRPLFGLPALCAGWHCVVATLTSELGKPIPVLCRSAKVAYIWSLQWGGGKSGALRVGDGPSYAREPGPAGTSSFRGALTSGNAATSLEYGRSQWEDVTQVKECGDIWDRDNGQERGQSRCLPSPLFITSASELMKAHGWRVVVLFQFVGKGILLGKCLLWNISNIKKLQ